MQKRTLVGTLDNNPACLCNIVKKEKKGAMSFQTEGMFHCDSDSRAQTSSQLLSSSPVTKFSFLLVKTGLKLSKCIEMTIFGNKNQSNISSGLF